MAITPQAIKDQEFQSKFRGYDTVEVKAYLELVAEDFFELLEKVRQQGEEIEALTQEQDLLRNVNEKNEAELEKALSTIEVIREESIEKDKEQLELQKRIDELQVAQADFEEERKEFEEEVSVAEERVSEIEATLRKRENEVDGLRGKIQLLEERVQELKNGEIDFKRTIGVAQQFADSLKQNARDKAEKIQRTSEEKASCLLQTAREEIERLRQDAFRELSRLPAEIEKLNEQKRAVREELRMLLTGYLEKVESVTVTEAAVKQYNYDDLFQKITVPDIDTAVEQPLVDVEDDIIPEDELETGVDDLAGIDLSLPIPDDIVFEKEDEAENENADLRNKLAQGGVAYLSDG
ncbi:MAG: hypothetical protein CSA26_04420 [Desulfobacterales bacterium]|nr:MAG: hypothetical protein CSA26_04420 [Desulfobacterales bacterium]